MRTRAFRRRFAAAVDLLKDLLGYYEGDQEDWEVHTFLCLLRGAVVSLAHYAQQRADGEALWDNPHLELQYDVNLDWVAFQRKGHVKTTYAILTTQDLDDSKQLWHKVARMFLEHRLAYLLRSLTSDVVTVIEKDRIGSLFPQEVLAAVENLTPRKRQNVLRELAAPFCWGCTHIDEREMRSTGPSARALKQLRSAAEGPSTMFTGEVANQRITGSVALTVSPLVVDSTTQRAYYPIRIALGFGSGDPPKLTRSRQTRFWKELVEGLDDLIAEQTTWDPSFFGHAEPWDRSARRALRAAQRIQAVTGGSLRWESVPRREFEELIAELYAGLGYRVRLTRQSKDGGRDVIVEKLSPIATRCIIECKRPDPGNKVKPVQVRALFGVARDEASNKALLVTSTGFTPEGRRLEAKHRWHLELIDARGLTRLARDYQPLAPAASLSTTA